MTTCSAPGKIILFGEHAVVYGRPALAVPVTQVQAMATVTATSQPGIWVDAPDIGIRSELSRLSPNHPLAAVIRSVFAALTSPPTPLIKGEGRQVSPTTLFQKGRGCKIVITSTIPVAAGLGSGAAVSVAVVRALSEFLGQSLPDERVSALAYEVEKLHHGTPSGIDNTVITYANPVYFVKSCPIETFHVAAPFTIVIGDTGIHAPTKESVGDVRRLWQADSPRWEKVFDSVGEIARQARRLIESGDIPAFGPLMDENHRLLQEMTVSCPELDQLVEAARRAGALGAKLSGSGRGGNMIALVRPEQAEEIAQALRSGGALRTIITTIQKSQEKDESR
jgi:mevalonate kinase